MAVVEWGWQWWSGGSSGGMGVAVVVWDGSGGVGVTVVEWGWQWWSGGSSGGMGVTVVVWG